ncbi:Hypothetical predicted protein [Xyrichtys novacula]|uniref:Uncharacterized protein n=1 Tax=Xyrichtys novacula TaxID=13765 RepID=A0AAV1G9G6_XYRNO|nr:Hypothetical predicted protein [Xyrichtys novacula]
MKAPVEPEEQQQRQQEEEQQQQKMMTMMITLMRRLSLLIQKGLRNHVKLVEVLIQSIMMKSHHVVPSVISVTGPRCCTG